MGITCIDLSRFFRQVVIWRNRISPGCRKASVRPEAHDELQLAEIHGLHIDPSLASSNQGLQTPQITDQGVSQEESIWFVFRRFVSIDRSRSRSFHGFLVNDNTRAHFPARLCSKQYSDFAKHPFFKGLDLRWVETSSELIRFDPFNSVAVGALTYDVVQQCDSPEATPTAHSKSQLLFPSLDLSVMTHRLVSRRGSRCSNLTVRTT